MDGQPRAFDAVCTHVQCTVEYRPAENDIFCNCHNGVYDLNGRNIVRSAAAAAGSLQGRQGQRKSRTGGDHCLPQRLTTRREKPRLEAAPPRLLLRAAGARCAVALAAKKRVPMHRSSVFYFLGGMALFLFGVQVVTGILLALVLQALARPGLRERPRDHDGGRFRLALPLDPLLEREPADRRPVPAPADHVHDAGLPAAAGIHLDDRRGAAGRLLHLRLQRLSAALEPIGVLRHAGGHGHCRQRARGGQVSAAHGPRRRRTSPATPWPASTPCTW